MTMSKYICDTCKKPKPIDTSALQVGDKVNFTVRSIGRSSASFKSKSGVIEAIDGDMCSVKYGSKIMIEYCIICQAVTVRTDGGYCSCCGHKI